MSVKKKANTTDSDEFELDLTDEDECDSDEFELDPADDDKSIVEIEARAMTRGQGEAGAC